MGSSSGSTAAHRLQALELQVLMPQSVTTAVAGANSIQGAPSICSKPRSTASFATSSVACMLRTCSTIDPSRCSGNVANTALSASRGAAVSTSSSCCRPPSASASRSTAACSRSKQAASSDSANACCCTSLAAAASRRSGTSARRSKGRAGRCNCVSTALVSAVACRLPSPTAACMPCRAILSELFAGKCACQSMPFLAINVCANCNKCCIHPPSSRPAQR